MRILFVTSAPLLQTPVGATSTLASMRYRVIMPAQQLSLAGHNVQVATTPEQGWNSDQLAGISADRVIFSKSFSTSNEELAKTLRARGIPVWFDICDNHFLHPVNNRHFEAMIDLADGLIASTPQLAAEVLARKGRQCHIISDPVECERGEARFTPRFPRLRLLWFGHPSNLRALIQQLGGLAELSRTLPLELRVVTNVGTEVHEMANRHGELGAPFPIVVDAWAPNMLAQKLRDSDMVILPTSENDYAAAKSPNRLTESLWAGRAVVAHRVPSYEAFSDCVWLGDDLCRGIRETVESGETVEQRILAGQRKVGRNHAPFVIGRHWLNALNIPRSPLRLNLGCGDKILPGYVNVDVVPARNGRRPDVLCDLHNLLPFEDGSADEILSVHVVEHFWRWEINEVIREWVRVLKPGGQMIIECPNLASACAQFMEQPSTSAEEDERGQRTMWVFYGDPRWKDPLMVHRWGYTPETLTRLLGDCGLIEVQQQPAQFKLREPRDMRIVGKKPAT